MNIPLNPNKKNHSKHHQNIKSPLYPITIKSHEYFMSYHQMFPSKFQAMSYHHKLPPCLGQQVTQSLFPPFRITCEPLQVPSVPSVGSGFGVKSSGVVQ
jgi:hypothetical protein